MQHCDVVLWLLVPADEDAAESIHPAVSTLDDPATCLGTRIALEFFRLLTARADVRGEAKLVDYLAHLVEVVALVHAHPLRLLRRGLGAFHWDAVESFANQLH